AFPRMGGFHMTAALEVAAFLPFRVPPRFDFLRFKALGELFGVVRCGIRGHGVKSKCVQPRSGESLTIYETCKACVAPAMWRRAGGRRPDGARIPLFYDGAACHWHVKMPG